MMSGVARGSVVGAAGADELAVAAHPVLQLLQVLLRSHPRRPVSPSHVVGCRGQGERGSAGCVGGEGGTDVLLVLAEDDVRLRGAGMRVRSWRPEPQRPPALPDLGSRSVSRVGWGPRLDQDDKEQGREEEGVPPAQAAQAGVAWRRVALHIIPTSAHGPASPG